MDKNWTTWNTQAMQALDRGDIEQAERAFRQACPLRVVSALYRAIQPREGAGAPRASLMCHCGAPKGPWQSREGTRSLQAAD